MQRQWQEGALWLIKLFSVSIASDAGRCPLQDSCLENPMDGGAWWAAVHGVAEGWTRLSDFTFTFHFHELDFLWNWRNSNSNMAPYHPPPITFWPSTTFVLASPFQPRWSSVSKSGSLLPWGLCIWGSSSWYGVSMLQKDTWVQKSSALWPSD